MWSRGKMLHGKFNAIWSGYEVCYDTGKIKYKFQTKLGVKGMNIPVILTVSDDKWTCCDEKGNKIELVSGYKYEKLLCN
jgi:hypothetical protein